jgi:hypothetical protein
MGRNESVEVLLRREQRKKCHKSCTAKDAILLHFIPVNYDQIALEKQIKSKESNLASTHV